MTSTIKTGVTLDTSALVAGESIDASDFLTPHNDSLAHHRAGKLSVTANDTHVKHLFDAISGSTNIDVSVTDASGDESLTFSLTGVVAAAFGGLGADISAITGVLKLTAGVASAATAGTDYLSPTGSETATNKTLDDTNSIDLGALDTGISPSNYVLAPDGTGGVVARAEGGGGATPIDWTITAGETLAERDFVFLDDSDSKWYKIDMDASPLLCGRLRGCVNESGGIATDATGTIRILGEVSGFSGLAAWSNVYASSTAGGYTQTRPNPTLDGAQVAIADMGWATTATDIFIAPDAVRYAKRATMVNDGTLTVEHHIDENGRNRNPRAFISSSGSGVANETYASGNRDDDEIVKESTVTGYTSDTCTGGTIDASSEQGSFPASNLFDDDTGTRWLPSGSTPHWGEYEHSTSRTIKRYTVTGSSVTSQSPADFELQYYNGATWETADSQSSITWTATETKTFDVSGSFSSTLWRLYVTATNGGGLAVSEMEMMENTTTDVTRLAQTFTLASEEDIASVGLFLKKTGSPADDLTVRIETVSSGDPTGTLVDVNATSTVAESTLTTGYTEISFELADTVTIASGTYAIVIQTDGSADASNYVEWGSDSSTPGYAGGEMLSYDGSSWSSVSADAIFTLYEPGTVYDEPGTIGRWSGGTRDFAARYDDGSGSDADTKTTIKNVTGVTQDVTLEIEVA